MAATESDTPWGIGLRLSLEFDKKIQKKNKKYFEKIDVKTLGQLQISLVKQGSPLFIAAKR